MISIIQIDFDCHYMFSKKGNNAKKVSEFKHIHIHSDHHPSVPGDNLDDNHTSFLYRLGARSITVLTHDDSRVRYTDTKKQMRTALCCTDYLLARDCHWTWRLQICFYILPPSCFVAPLLYFHCRPHDIFFFALWRLACNNLQMTENGWNQFFTRG